MTDALAPFLGAAELAAFCALCPFIRQLLTARHRGILHRALLASELYGLDLDTVATVAWFYPYRDGLSARAYRADFTDRDAAQILQLAWCLRRRDLGGRFQHTDRVMLHKDKIVGMSPIFGSSLITACSFDATVSINHISGRVRGSDSTNRQQTLVNPQLHLHHTSTVALTCLTTFDVPGRVQVIAAGDKSGNLILWSTTLFGCKGAENCFQKTTVLDETKVKVNLSRDHIRSMIYLGRASRLKLQDMDLLLVGDGDGLIFVVCIKFQNAHDSGTGSDEGDARFDISVLQTTTVHSQAVIGLQETSDGFVSMDKGGECGVWSLASASLLSGESRKTSAAGILSESDRLVHFSLESISKIVPANGRAVTCLALASEHRVGKQKGQQQQNECKDKAGTVSDQSRLTSRWRRMLVVGTRGCYGTKNKSIRALLKDHCVLGVSMDSDGSHDILWRLPIPTTVMAVFPLGHLVIVVAERGSDEANAVSVWDTHSGEELSRFGCCITGERITRLLPCFDSSGRLASWFVGCDSGAILQFHDGEDLNIATR